MYDVSFIGFGPYVEIMIGLFFLLLYSLQLKLEAYLILISTILSATLGTIIKVLVNRPRPDAALVDVITKLNDKSFPSNHVLVYTVFFGFLFYISETKIKNHLLHFLVSTISLFLLMTVGLSRIYLGAHWASDVLGGYLLGAVFLLLTLKVYRIIESNAKR